MFFDHLIFGLIYTLFVSWLITQECTNTKNYQVLVNYARMHKYQELSKSINPLITIDAFNDFLIQSRNPFLHMICSCHICSCMFLAWTLNFGFAITNLLNSLWVHTYELHNVRFGFFPFWRLYFMLNIMMFLNILMFFNTLHLMKVVYLFPSKTTWSI